MKSFTVAIFLLLGQAAVAEFGLATRATREIRRRSLNDVGSLDDAGTALDGCMSLEWSAKAAKQAKTSKTAKGQKGEAPYVLESSMPYSPSKGSADEGVSNDDPSPLKLFKSASKSKGSAKDASKSGPTKSNGSAKSNKGSAKSKGGPAEKGGSSDNGGSSDSGSSDSKSQASAKASKGPSPIKFVRSAPITGDVEEEQATTFANAESGAFATGVQGAVVAVAMLVVGIALVSA